MSPNHSNSTEWRITRETIALAVATGFFLAVCVFLAYGHLFVHNDVGDVDRAKRRIEHCRTKEEIRAILGRPNTIQQDGQLWTYYDNTFWPFNGLNIEFDAQGNVAATRACIY